MGCDELVELVTAFLDGALSETDEGRFAAHLAACHGCATYLDQFRQTIQNLGRLPSESLSDEARAALLSAFRDWDTKA
jgi:anti-sigma factor RsiW